MLRTGIAVGVIAASLLSAPVSAQEITVDQETEAGSTAWPRIRTLLGLVLVGSGAAMLAAEPRQPIQPDLVSPSTLSAEFSRESLGFVDLTGGPPFRHADPAWDDLLVANYVAGGIDGLALGGDAMRHLVWRDGRELYTGAVQPYRRRSGTMRYGGLAAIAAGSVLLIWRGGGDGEDDDPVRLHVGPGGAAVVGRIAF